MKLAICKKSYKSFPRMLQKTLFVMSVAVVPAVLFAQATLTVQWNKQELISSSTPTLQVVVNPPLRRGAALHDPAFAALKNLQADYVRFVPWLPYPQLGVAELEPPANGKSFWDFRKIDPLVIDFLEATKGHPVVLNFSTAPQWMYKTDQRVAYPADPDAVVWDYTQGNVLNDTTAQQLAGYYARLNSWYTKGGFTDELGKYHTSNYHYTIPYWEILNEPDGEHALTPQRYTKQYDAIASAVSKVAPQTKFVGMSLMFENNPEFFEYFLNHNNHKAGVPLDAISYHFYATSIPGQTIGDMQYTYFERADGFISKVRYIETIRKRLSPRTKTTINEVGSILHNEESPIDAAYWNLSGALYAYLYLELTKLGIDVIGESQLVGYPTQFPSVSMMNWQTGKPNARYWTLKLIKDNLGAGDVLAETGMNGEDGQDIAAQAFKTAHGNKLLLINKRNRSIPLALPAACKGWKMTTTDIGTGDSEPVPSVIDATNITLKPFAVAVLAE